MKSIEVTDIIEDVVKATSAGCAIRLTYYDANVAPQQCPPINYVFGNGQYVKDHLDELSKTTAGESMKFPLIALFCPVREQRGIKDCHSKATIRILIACSSRKEWSNEERRYYSFANILRPIYNSFISALKSDKRLDIGYGGEVPHGYSENYSYGRYGAYTDAGEEVSEPIDAIDITNLEIKIKKQNCR